MALTECPECGGQVSDKAMACPNCGCPIETDLLDNCHHEDASFRITKDESDTTIRFSSGGADYVYLECSQCGRIYKFKRGYFDEVDENGCTSPIQIECPNCKAKKRTQKSADSATGDNAWSADGRNLSYLRVGIALIAAAMVIAQILPPLGPVLLLFGLAALGLHCLNRPRTPKDTDEEKEVAPVSGEVLHEQLKKMEQRDRDCAHRYNNYKYTCPMCGGHRIKTIGTGRKMASAVTLGVAGRSLGRNYQCDDCNYRW